MNGGRFRIDMEMTNRLPVPVDEETVRRLMERLSIYLPVGTTIAEISTDPATQGVEFVAVISAPSPGDALQILRAAMEYLRQRVRVEHGLDPIGPEAVLRRVCITYETDDKAGDAAAH
jgi:hypothetical protein